MSITFDFNSGASLASLGFTSISASLTNTAAAGQDGSYAMKVDTSISNGSGSAAYAVNLTKRKITFHCLWNRLYWTHTSGPNAPVAFRNFDTGASAFDNGTPFYMAELGWGNFPTTPATSTLFSSGVTAPRTAQDYQISASEAPFGSFNGSGFVRTIQGGFPDPTSGWHDLDIVLIFSTWDAANNIAFPNGSVTYSIDGVTIFSMTSARIGNPVDAIGTTHSVSSITFAPLGVFDDIVIDEEDFSDATPSIPQNNSAECCASPGIEGQGTVAPGAGVERPVLMSAAWIGLCDGGGTVPLLADLTDAENWSDS